MRVLRLLLFVVFLCSGALALPEVAFRRFATIAFAQDDFFRPALEPSPTPAPAGPPPIFSFARFQPRLAEVCQELEADGRRERFVQIAQEEAARESKCISCRALWRSVVAACEKPGRKPRPTKIPTVAANESGAEAVTEATTTNAEDPKRERHPSTILLDITSRLSTELYETDSGDGPISTTFKHLAATVVATKDLTPAEREYFDTFTTYLLAAWQGRIEASRLPTPTPRALLGDFFE